MINKFVNLAIVSLLLPFGSIASTKISLGVTTGGIEYTSGKTSDEPIDEDSMKGMYGYFDFGESYKLELTVSNYGEYLFSEHSEEISALIASIVYSPKEYAGFTPYGKLGYGYLSLTQRFSLLGTEIENKTTGDALVAGVGVEYNPSELPNIGIRLAYDYLYFSTSRIVDDKQSDNSLKGLSLGLTIHFD